MTSPVPTSSRFTLARGRIAVLAAIALLAAIVPVTRAMRADAAPTFPAYQLAVSNAELTEADTGFTSVTFTLTLTPAPIAEADAGVTVNYMTVDPLWASGTTDVVATPGTDYVAVNRSVTFEDATTTRSVTVLVMGDNAPEPNEVFELEAEIDGQADTPRRGTGTIKNEDGAGPSIRIDDASVHEGDSGTPTATFAVTRTGDTSQPVDFSWQTNAGTTHPAGAGDYGTVADALNTIPQGAETMTIDVSVTPDTAVEMHETFRVTLRQAWNAGITDSEATGTILDDDEPQLRFVDTIVGDEAGIDEDDLTRTFTVEFTNTGAASGRTVTVDYTTTNDSATAPSDYTAKTGTLLFNPGETSKTIVVTTVDDTLTEPIEDFDLTLSNPTNATLHPTTTAAGRIVDEDGNPTVQISNPSITEKDAGTDTVTFTVTIPLSAQTVTADYRTVAGTAQAGSDYVHTTGQIAFAPGETSKPVAVTVNGDAVAEGNETFVLDLHNLQNANDCASPCGTATIVDNEAVAVSLHNAVVAEGDPPATTTLPFVIQLSTAVTQATKVYLKTEDISARSTGTSGPEDYTAKPSNTEVEVAAGSTTAQVEVEITEDMVAEPTETFRVVLERTTVGTLDDPVAVGEINDDDEGARPALAIADQTTVESANLNLTVTLTNPGSPPTAHPYGVSVKYTATAGTATAPGDFNAVTGTLTFGATETTKTITVPVVSDTTDEVHENLTVNLHDASNADITRSVATGTITDDDGPTLVVSDAAAVTEGDSGTKEATFEVSILTASPQNVTYSFTTTDGTAKDDAADNDYEPATGTQTFAPGGPLKHHIKVTVNGDTVDEDDEAFTLDITSTTNAGPVGDPSGSATILDDDGPAISVADADELEGDGGTANEVVFPVTLSAASPQDITFDFATVHVTAVTADYVARSGTLTFEAGTDEVEIRVPINGDTADEDDETFKVVLSTPSEATIDPDAAEAIGTIDDDDGPGLSVQDTTVTEGNTGTTEATFNVTLGAASPQTVTVDYATADGTANKDTDDVGNDDYDAKTGTLVFPANSTAPQQAKVVVNGDTVDETDETFTLTLSTPQNATISDGQATATITDDDGPTLSITPTVTVVEGFSGQTTNATFTVSISGSSVQPVSVDYTTVDQTANEPADYAKTSGTLTFNAGTSASQSIPVPVKGDNIDEVDETFKVVLSNPQDATLSNGEGVGTITNDDEAPSISVGSPSITEGDHSSVTVTVNVTLSTPSGKTVTAGYTTRNGTATEPGDYTKATSTLTFAPGETTKPINLLIAGDTLHESNETFFVDLTTVTNATVADGEGEVTIVNNDPVPPPQAPKQGYWMTGRDAGIFNYGAAEFYGSMGDKQLNAPIVGIAESPSGKGYWQVASDGGVFAWGDAMFLGSKGGERLNQPVVGMAATPDGKGYWLVAADGGIFTFGTAKFMGSKGGERLNKPVVGMAATPDGNGYWLVASDGGIFTFGNATFMGSKGGETLNQPIVGMAATPNGGGYWMVAADGGIFTFGKAGFFGSTGGRTLNAPVVGMARTPTGNGYWLAGADGAIFAFGDAKPLGSKAGQPLNGPIVGIAAHPG